MSSSGESTASPFVSQAVEADLGESQTGTIQVHRSFKAMETGPGLPERASSCRAPFVCHAFAVLIIKPNASRAHTENADYGYLEPDTRLIL